MRIIPSLIGTKTCSTAEQKIFKYFEGLELKENAVCFHSLRLSQHIYKRCGEIDFLLVTMSGIYVLEVKGGAIKRDLNGIWNFTDRYGVVHKKTEGPFQQAESAMYSLQALLRRHFGESSEVMNIVYGSGVIFPDHKFDIQSPEWAPETVLDRSKTASLTTFSAGISRLKRYWTDKKRTKVTLTSSEFEKLIRFLRPNFELVPSLGYRVDELNSHMDALTNEQYEKFDAIEANEKIVCTGGAGTGKTFLALEVARRHFEKGQSVIYFAKGIVFAAHVRAKLPEEIVVCSNTSHISHQKFEVLIVDEGQDLMTIKELTDLERVLKNGFENGVWRIFLDKNNQVGVSGAFDETAYELIKLYKPAFISLTRNCRNTANIVKQTQLITSADIGIPSAGAGPEVTYVYTDSNADALKKLNDSIEVLLCDDILPGDITILSPVSFETSIVSKLTSRLASRIVKLDHLNALTFPSTNITYATIHDFKGMENKFIFLVDLNDTHFHPENISMVYVAMTRAKAGLSFILPSSEKKSINDILIKSFNKIYLT